MAANKINVRQIVYRSFLSQIANRANFTADQYNELDNLLVGINGELNPSFAMSANATPNLILNVGSNIVSNTETGMRHMAPSVNKQFPGFTSGTITLPATTGGTITVSPTVTANPTLTMGANDYVAALIEVDSTGNLSVTLGTPQSSEANALLAANLPGVNAKARQIGFLIIQAISSNIQNVTPSRIIQFQGGGGAGGSSTGSGVGDDLNALQFLVSSYEGFDELPSDALSSVDYSAGRTPSSGYSSVNQYLRLSYDASKTVTGTGTAMTISATPSYTVAVGDILTVGNESRRITVVTTQTSYTIEAAFTTNPAAAACNISQAAYTKDLNNYAGSGIVPSSAISSSISQVMAIYDNSAALNDIIDDVNTTPLIAYTASSDNTSFTTKQVRATNLIDETQIVNLPTSGTNLYLRFFSNATSGSGAVNLLKFKAFFHRQESFADGSLQNQAYGFTNGVGTEINMTLSVVGGKTRATLPWSYPVGLNSGTTNGALDVYLNGQKGPRFIDATLTPNFSYKEIDQRTIELDLDYSALNYALEIVYRYGSIDQSETNSTAVVQNQEQFQKGFQPFVDTTPVLTATTSVGTPAAGRFYSQILGRKNVLDLSQDLSARMGPQRIETQELYLLHDEYGASGQVVRAVTNDMFNQIRLVGSWTAEIANDFGPHLLTSTVNDYIEVVFYGTGLNVLLVSDNTSRTLVTSVDGGTDSATFYPASGSAVLSSRQYATNQVVSAVSGLTLGVHTVQIKFTAGVNFRFYGVESVLNVDSIRALPGSSFNKAKKLTSSTLDTISFNSGFESGILGSRGGRVLLYQKADGTRAKSVQPVDAAQANLTLADHTNEEVIRTYYWREFGANRTDDFSSLTAAGSRVFVLNDGTTTLHGSQIIPAVVNANECLRLVVNGGTNSISLTFVGTGLDISRIEDIAGSTDTVSVTVDGTSIGNLSTTATTTLKWEKIVSGLPYGTHVVRFTTTGSTRSPGFVNFKVYQPKKPTLPDGATEISDYNVTATFVGNTTAGASTISTGVIRKSAFREVIYSGTFSAGTDFTNAVQGQFIQTSTVGNYTELVFYGTGFDVRFNRDTNRSTSILVAIDGTNYTGAGTGYSSTWTPGTSTLNKNGAAQVGAGFYVTGLTLGVHRVRFTNNNANFMSLETYDIISPIHSYQFNLPYDKQSTLPIASATVGDSRKFSPVKSESPNKNIVSATGIQLNPSTSSTTFVPCPDLSVTYRSSGEWVEMSSQLTVGASSGAFVANAFYVNGSPVGPAMSCCPGTSLIDTLSMTYPVYLPAGIHRVDVYWRTNGTVTADLANRSLTVKGI